MVTGFNTDVGHDGRVYHVQTEDKGVGNPIIETLIYVGGEILAARRTSYADLLGRGVDEKEIAARIEAQHNRMILDVREGKYSNKRNRPFGEGIISSKSFDEVVLEYLMSEAAAGRMAMQMIRGEGFVEGEMARLELLVTRAADGAGIAAAKVKVKLITTVDKPRVIVEGATDESGVAALEVALPVVKEGTAALIIQAASGRETSEIKQIIRKPARKAGRSSGAS